MAKWVAMVVCPFRALVDLHRVLPTFTWYELFNVWDTVSSIVHLPRVFLPMDFPFEWIELVFMNLLYIIFTYYYQDNE